MAVFDPNLLLIPQDDVIFVVFINVFANLIHMESIYNIISIIHIHHITIRILHKNSFYILAYIGLHISRITGHVVHRVAVGCCVCRSCEEWLIRIDSE